VVAGPKKARSMKAYLGLRDTAVVYRAAPVDPAERWFGPEPGARNFVRLRMS